MEAKEGAAPASEVPESGARDQDRDPGIPDDVATGVEELPPGFWDAPPPSAPSRSSRPHSPRAQSPRAQSPRERAPRPQSQQRPPEGGASGEGEVEAGTADTGTSDAATGGDLERALLGGEATADELPEALRDTVDALQELFPGELLAVTPRAGDGEDGTETGEEAGAGAGDPEGEDADEAGDTTPRRDDAG